jgi:integrase/recombinase XerD
VLTIYRRHQKGCSYTSRDDRRCQCPVWVQGSLPDEPRIRESLDTRNWQKASEQVHEWEAAGTRHKAELVTVSEAIEKYTADVRDRHLSAASAYKYKLMLDGLKAFAEREGIGTLAGLTPDVLARFRSEWKGSPLTLSKKLERLKTFFRFCREFGLMAENPAKPLKPPKVRQSPTLPFSQQQLSNILGAVAAYGQRAAHNAKLNALRIRALVLVMRYGGLRIGDAVSLTPDRIVDGKLALYTQKTGTHVRVPLPEFVTAALESTPPTSGPYLFWTGTGSLTTAIKMWENRLKRIFNHAGLPEAHSHQFRDTFAVELLLAGVSIEEVAALLGHSNIRVTQKHYAPWIQARQDRAESNVRRAWAADSLVLTGGKGTPEVHGATGAVN